MDSPVCCVCQKPVGAEAPRIGRRAYCDKHYAKVSRDRQSVWQSAAYAIAAMVLFAVLVAVVANWLSPSLEGTPLVLVGVVLALVPAILWLVFFYVQDAIEPEPKTYVLAVFVLGALLASAIGIPVVRNLFRVQDWLGRGFWLDLLVSVLIIGFVQEFLKYAAVRYSVYLSSEFDERMDGILYGTAAGLGYATMLNIFYVVDSGGVDLGMGILRIVVTALAQASFAGITGYFLARAKFEDEPVWWLPAGLTLAAVLNGLFGVVRGEITRTGSVLSQRTVNPWNGLILGAVVAGLTLAALLVLIRRANRMAQTGEQGA